MSAVEVVRVVSTHPPTQGAFVEINASDFDPAVHTPYVDEAPAQADAQPAAAPAPKGRRVPKTLP